MALGQGCHVLLAVLACLLLMAACTVRLAPDFDRGILDGLIKANEQTLVLFAAVSSGVKSNTFRDRVATYNGLVGRFDAARVQVLSRPAPQPMISQLLGIGPSLDPRSEEIETFEAPTDKILETIVDTLKEMRDTDERRGLTPSVVKGFKRSYRTSIDQALTYEMALER